MATKYIEPEDAAFLSEKLKALPPDAVQAVLEKFKVKRVPDLKARDVGAATVMVGMLEGKKRAPSSGNGEIDPFE